MRKREPKDGKKAKTYIKYLYFSRSCKVSVDQWLRVLSKDGAAAGGVPTQARLDDDLNPRAHHQSTLRCR